jgi:PIN domain nuclease of toxin-antitoxin system
MRLLLDTHTFLWFIYREPTGERFYELCLNPDNQLFLSAASYWEICIKASLGKMGLADNWIELFDHEMEVNGIRWLPIESHHCRELLSLPHHHRDPFDRLLIGQARTEGLALLSADPNLRRYDVPVIW